MSWEEQLAYWYQEKAINEPWLCNANDVLQLVDALLSVCKERDEYSDKYGKSLTDSIQHSEAMLGNLVVALCERAGSKGEQ